eukprot:7384493-Prymnesium_polylepis.4
MARNELRPFALALMLRIDCPDPIFARKLGELSACVGITLTLPLTRQRRSNSIGESDAALPVASSSPYCGACESELRFQVNDATQPLISKTQRSRGEGRDEHSSSARPSA